MPSHTIETIDIDATVQFDDDTSDADPAYLDIMRVTHLATALFSELLPGDESLYPDRGANLRAIVKEESLAGEFSEDREEYMDELWRTVQIGTEIVTGEGSEARRRDLAANIDEDTLRELRATVGYVGKHLGIDVTLPTLEEVREA